MQLLKTLSKSEFKNFGKFVSSPFFYKDKTVIKLYDSLKAFYPDFIDETLTKELIFSKIYPGKAYNDSLMKYLMSEMFAMGKKFLAYVNFSNDFLENDIRFLKELNLRNASKIFVSQHEKSESKIKNHIAGNEDYFYSLYRLKETAAGFYSYRNRLSPKIEHNKIIEAVLNNFLISLLRRYYIMQCDKRDYFLNIDLNLTEDIKNIIEKHNSLISPITLIPYNIFMLLYKNEHPYFLNVVKLKDKYLNLCDNTDKHYIYEELDSYCIRKISEGDLSFYRTAFNLSCEEIEKGVRFNFKVFSDVFFTNKVDVASKLKEFKWAHNFIEKYKDRLSNEHRQDIVNFSYAIIEFESKKYTTSLDHLAKINLQHPLLKFRVRNYTLLNYFELGYVEQAFSMIDTYKHMLANDKKIEPGRKKRYNSFLSLYQKLMDTKSGNKDNEKGMLKREIESKSVFMKQWLLEKACEL